MKTTQGSESYDIIVLGSGISGSLLSLIMANKGYKVMIIDGAAHPKFAIGESTTPNTSQMFELLGKRHKIPEILALASGPQSIRGRISTACGVKRAFVFLYHREGQELSPSEANVFGNVWRDENHLYRQDVDAYLFRSAISYGADALENHRVTGIDFSNDGVEVTTDKGKVITSRYLVDGTGPRSPLVDKLELRENAPELHTKSRTIFSHCVDVKPFEECTSFPTDSDWPPGTYHHLFDGGWFWVIPFNNWDGATNQTVSVGLTLDIEKYPRPDGLSPEEEFRQFVERFPSVAKQFADAKAVRPWVAVPKLQYSSRAVVGERYCLMAHTAGFVDPLFSSGLVMTVSTVHKLIDPLCRALDTNRFLRTEFAAVEEDSQRRLRFADMLVFGSYTAFRDYELWNVWVRVWAIGMHALESILGSHLLMGEYSKYRLVNDPIVSEYEPEGYRVFVEAAFDLINKVAEGKLKSAEATTALWQLIRDYAFEIRLRPGPEFAGAEWAMKSANVRNLFLGVQANHLRWQNQQADPWLLQ